MLRTKFNSHFIVACCALAFATAAAGAAPSPDVSTSPSPAVAVPTSPTIRYSAVELTDKVVKHLGQTADQFTFRITNDSGSPVKYDFSSGQQIDLIVTDATGIEVWNYGKSRTFKPLITHHTLKKGQTLTYSVLWDRRDQGAKPVPAGIYNVTASLKTLPRLVVSSTSTIDPTRENGDPTNVGLAVNPDSQRASDSSQSGGAQQNDIAPSVSAKTTVTVQTAS